MCHSRPAAAFSRLGGGWIAPLATLPLLAWFAAACGMAPVGTRAPDSGALAERPKK